MKYLLFALLIPFAAHTSTLTVELEAKKPNKGVFYCALFDSSNGFPRDSDLALEKEIGQRNGNQTACIFEGLRPGNYAVSVIQDLNNNGTLDLAFLANQKSLMGYP